MDDFYLELSVSKMQGLTTEQFIDVWKTESLRRQQKQHDSSDMQTAGGDLCRHQSPQCQQLYERLMHDLHKNFQFLQSQQEEQWKQLNIRLDQVIAEFRSGYESLSSLAVSVAESKADSIKLRFMQELELVKQDIMKVVTTNHIGIESDHVASEVSFLQGGPAAAQIEIPRNSSGFVKPYIDAYRNMNGHSGNKLNGVVNESTAECFSTLHQLHNQISEGSSHQLSQSSQNTAGAVAAQGAVDVTLDTGIQQDITGESYAHVVTRSHASDTGDSFKVSARPADTLVLHPSSLTTLGGSVEATGSYAKVVSSQMKQMQSSRTSSVSSRPRSDSPSSLNNMNSSMPAKNHNSSTAAKQGQQVFTIGDSQKFSVSNKPYLSKFMYSSGKRCKARVRVNIESSGVLVVHIHVSKGVYDDSHTWPLRLLGLGYGWNVSSARYTQVWQLDPVLCEKPPSAEKELIFKADVCLKTSRGSYANIKYHALVDKHYVGNDRITFMWDLHAEEN